MNNVEIGMNSVMHYGKYEGRRVDGILEQDPQYLKNLHEFGNETFDQEVIQEIEKL